MGTMDTVTIYIDEGVALPSPPSNHHEIEWVSQKGLLDRSQGPYKISADGCLLKKEVGRVQTGKFETLELESDSVKIPKMKTISEEWVLHPQHGSFEFHATINNTWYAYEARFTNGELDTIILLQKTDPTNNRNILQE